MTLSLWATRNVLFVSCCYASHTCHWNRVMIWWLGWVCHMVLGLSWTSFLLHVMFVMVQAQGQMICNISEANQYFNTFVEMDIDDFRMVLLKFWIDIILLIRLGRGGERRTRRRRPHHACTALPLSPSFERGERAVARPYAHGCPCHSPKCRNFRLFLIYSSFVYFLHIFALHCNIATKYCRPECKRNRRRPRRHWPKRGGYDKRTRRSRRSRWPRCTTTFEVCLSKWVFSSHRCNSLWLLLLLLLRWATWQPCSFISSIRYLENFRLRDYFLDT